VGALLGRLGGHARGLVRRVLVVLRSGVRASGRVLANRRLRSLLGDRRVRSAAVAVLSVLAVIVVLGLLIAAFDARDPRTDEAAESAVPSGAESAPEIRFPEPASSALAPEDRVRPVGVRSIELGFETAVGAESTAPSCATSDAERDRAVWFDPGASDEGTDGGTLVAVAPGEHGVAVLLGPADGDRVAAPLRGIGLARQGTLIEVARSNGTVLGWKVVDVVRAPAGSGLPTSVLTPVDEQRLLLIGCGATVDGAVLDVYVLALRDR
jgi:hypothetical protein